MFWKELFVFSVLLLFGVQSQVYSDLQFADPFDNNWSWLSNIAPDQRGAFSKDLEIITERDREPLGPDFRDPDTQASEDKPVVKPKSSADKGIAFNPSVIPGGVIDVDASGLAKSGFPSLGGIDHDFGFTGTFGAKHPDGGLFGLGSFFGSLPEYKPWWKGPNVCIEREESTDDGEEDVKQKQNETEEVPNLFATSISLSNCQQTANKYECVTKVNNHGVVKTFTVRYKCCYGFTRVDNSAGCEKKVDLKPLLDTIDDLGAKEFRKVIQNTGLEDMYKNGNYTVFVPTDVAFTEFSEKMLELNAVELTVDAVRRRRDIKNALSSRDLALTHTTKGFVDLADLVNEEIIYSEYDNTSLRINTYPTRNYGRMVTVNCAKISKPNNLAENGIVHVTEDVILPARRSLQDIIKEHPQLTNLKQVFEVTDSFKNLRLEGHFTIFAPTDEAFNKLEESAKQKLLRGDACALSILKHHVTPHTVCTAAIIGNTTTHNVEGININIERTSDDQLILEGKAKITKQDVIGTNGVIHFIDTLLIPESAMHITEALKSENLTKFQELINKAGIADEIDGMKNTTVFVPEDEAFEHEKIKKYLEEIGDDKEKLKELVLYHTIQGKLESCEMQNDAMLKSNDQNKPLRLNLYSTVPLFTNIINRATINCARITGFDEKSCGSVIHEINRVLMPPTKNILDLINEEEKFSTLRKIIKDTDVEAILKDEDKAITLLAPTDETFAGIKEEDLKALIEDKEKASVVLKNHILNEVLCCSGVGPQSIGFNTLVPTVAHRHHQVGRTGTHQIRIGNAVVTHCDKLATNGVVHTVNKVLFPQRQPSTNFGGFFIFDF